MSFGEFVELIYLVLTMVCSWTGRSEKPIPTGMNKNSRIRQESQRKWFQTSVLMKIWTFELKLSKIDNLQKNLFGILFIGTYYYNLLIIIFIKIQIIFFLIKQSFLFFVMISNKSLHTFRYSSFLTIIVE